MPKTGDRLATKPTYDKETQPMLTISRAIQLGLTEDRCSLESVATIAAIFVARCVIGSEKRDVVRNEIKSVIETLPDGETKTPKSTLNANVALGLKLAFNVSSAKGKLSRPRDWLATVAMDADMSTADETQQDNVQTLMAMLALQTIIVKNKNGDEFIVPVTNRSRLAKLLAPTAKAKKDDAFFQSLNSAITRKAADNLSLDQVATLQAALKLAANQIAARALADLAKAA